MVKPRCWKERVRRWFCRFRVGRPTAIKVEGIIAKIEQDWRVNSRNIAKELCVYYRTVFICSKTTGYEEELHDRISVYGVRAFQ